MNQGQLLDKKTPHSESSLLTAEEANFLRLLRMVDNEMIKQGLLTIMKWGINSETEEPKSKEKNCAVS